jgi:hypothetical protein
MQKYAGIFNNLTAKEIIIPGLKVATLKNEMTGVTGLANEQTKKFEIKKEGLSVAQLGTEPGDRSRVIVQSRIQEQQELRRRQMEIIKLKYIE